MQNRAKHYLMNATKWLLSAAALYYVVREIDISELTSMMTTQNPIYLIGAAALLLLQAGIATLRWQKLLLLLKPSALFEFKPLFVINYISMFFNNCLPGTIGGDIIRVLMIKSKQMPVSTAAYSVIIDRLLAVIGIVVMVALGLPYLAPLIGMHYGWLVMLVILFLILRSARIARFALIMVNRFPDNRLIKTLAHFLEYLLKSIEHPLDYATLILQAVLAHTAFCASVYLISESLSVSLSFMSCLLLVPPMLLISMVPISMGGWGVRELSMVYLLALAGVEKAPALLISIQLGVLMMVSSLPAVLLWLQRKRNAHE